MSLTDRIKEYFAPAPGQVRVRDVVREIPGATKDVAKEIAQGTARSVASLGISAGNVPFTISDKISQKLGGKKIEKPFDSRISTSNDPVSRFVFGGKDILDVPETGKYISKEFEDITGKKINPAVAPFLGFGARVVDVIPSGKEVKEGLNLTKELADEVINSKNVNRIKQIMLGTGQIDEKDATTIARVLKDVSNPKEFDRVTNILKERGYVKSVKTIAPDAEKVAGSYIPRSTDELSIKASNLIKDDIFQAEEIVKTQTDENAVAIASELIKKYSDDAVKATSKSEADALYDKVADIANTLAPKLTELGRAVQAASILGRMTPEGQIRFAAKTIENYNRLNPSKRIPGLTKDQVEFFSKESREIFNMPDGVDKAARFQKMQSAIQDLVPTPLWKKLTTIWKAGLLTGIKTSGLNIASNLSHFTAETIKDVPAAAVDSVASLFTGKRTTTATARGTLKGIKEGFGRGSRYLRTGFDERNIAGKLDYNHINFGKGPVAKLFQTYTDSVFRVIGAQDQPFYYGALSRSLADQSLATAYNLGYKGSKAREYAKKLSEDPSEEMITAATLDALTAVFQNKTAVGEVGKKLRNAIPGGELIMPFVQTPASVAMQIVNYTPAGAVLEVGKQIYKKEFNQRAFSKAMGRSATGLVPLYLGTQLFKNDMVSLEFPQTERERNQWEAEGRKDNSILIDGKWRDPIVLGPMGNLLLLGAYFQRGVENAASPALGMFNGLKESAANGFDALKEQTFLTGINQFTEAFNDPARYGEAYISSLAGSIVPTIFSDVAKAIDPKERRASGPTERVQSRIPVAREGLEPKVDILGREIERKGNPLEVMIDPTRPLPDTSTPLLKELRRLQDAGNDVTPTKLGDKKGFAALSEEQNTELWKRAGELTDAKLSALVRRPEYQKANDLDRSKAIKKVTEQVQVLARAEAVAALTAGLSDAALVARLKELRRDSKFLNQDVYRQYLEIR